LDRLLRDISVYLGRLLEVGNLSALPIEQNCLAHVVRVWLATLKELSGLDGDLVYEVFGVCPVVDAKNVCNVL
jgi:hypothetical protein